MVGYQHCPMYGKFMLVESGIQEIFLVKSGIAAKESGIPQTIGTRNPSSANKESGLLYPDHSVESRIPDCLGLPCMTRVCISYWSTAASVSDVAQLLVGSTRDTEDRF